MVFILSISEDISTYRVCRWLKAAGEEYVVLTEKESIFIEKVTENDIYFRIQDHDCTYQMSEIKAHWFRRGKVTIDLGAVRKDNKTDLVHTNRLMERNTLEEYFTYCLNQKPRIDNYYLGDVNKLIINDLAKNRLQTVPYILTDSKAEARTFLNEHKRAIVKPITPYFENLGKLLSYTTKEVTMSDLEDHSVDFGLSYFQKLIEKKFEIRSFFFEGECYSTAIFSQSNAKTEIDFRNYDYLNPNRQVPFVLPADIKQASLDLMKEIGLTSCSMDFIYSKEGEIFFLEVNPVGQFGPSSSWGNYGLEKRIATSLIQLSHDSI